MGEYPFGDYSRPPMFGHGRYVCSCGAVIVQCRCMTDHGMSRVVPNGCPACRESAPPQPAPATIALRREVI